VHLPDFHSRTWRAGSRGLLHPGWQAFRHPFQAYPHAHAPAPPGADRTNCGREFRRSFSSKRGTPGPGGHQLPRKDTATYLAFPLWRHARWRGLHPDGRGYPRPSPAPSTFLRKANPHPCLLTCKVLCRVKRPPSILTRGTSAALRSSCSSAPSFSASSPPPPWLSLSRKRPVAVWTVSWSKAPPLATQRPAARSSSAHS